MGFKDARSDLINCLKAENYQHEDRSDIESKNLLSTGEINAEEVIELAKACNGKNYETSKHHFLPNQEVHILIPTVAKQKWYIKFYFVEPDVWFLSVHK